MKRTLFFIFIIAIFFRIYLLSSVPANVHIDELSFGYNAYALSETVRDEYGEFLPLQLQSFDDYRPALYSYLMIPMVKIFGLSTVSIRLTSVIISLGTLFGIYLLTREFLKNKRKEDLVNSIGRLVPFDTIPLFVAFLYAISPWSIFFSRLAIDTTAGQFFFVYGLLFFVRFINTTKKNMYLYVSTIFFLLCFYAYNGVKLFLPPFIFFLCILYRKELFVNRKAVLVSLLLVAILLLPMINFYISKQNSLIRLNTTSIFSQKKDVVDITALRFLKDKQNNDYLGYIFDNRRFVHFSIFVSNYLLNFNPVWLYTSNGLENYKSSDIGLFYLFELPLLILGIYFLIRYHILQKKISYILIFWILFAALPSGFTTEAPHATRSYNMLPPLLIIEGFGLYYLFYLIKHIQQTYLKISSYFILTSILCFFLLWFMHSYYVTFKRESSHKYQYGIQEAISYAKNNENQYKKIIVSNKGNLLFSYMYYLFFTTYNPDTYIKNGGTQSGAFNGNNIIGKYAFIDPNFYSDGKRDSFNKRAYESNDPSTLYIVDITDLPLDPAFWEDMERIHTIKSLEDKDVIVILKRKYN